ncbi:tripartite tricarboxylate transporter TctB family protein [Bradyrhizobium archetypum]|uniref:Tripartite tricarboxylate transporter TctB family protein n=1 Tax=Bradyrhizobium archetypum TaxID=2721160 RepID=A0A7Y4M1E6_9BRAD|nr:tripartite tricarboxylate transporter TctB family protein [Bradyrhizobium archetypum]NOJ45825.1 tripartite tricarboxylate transporter TctB family protein [Bradyrhizobium archetypum]
MTRSRIDLQDLLFGLFLVAVAAATLVATRNLTVGHAADMGPGYMPRVVALALMGFGIFFTGRGLWRMRVGIAPVQWRPLLAILASVGVFALTAERLGLAIASVAAVMLASFATREGRLVETVAFALLLSGAAVLLFVKLLGLPIPIWPR